MLELEKENPIIEKIQNWTTQLREKESLLNSSDNEFNEKHYLKRKIYEVLTWVSLLSGGCVIIYIVLSLMIEISHSFHSFSSLPDTYFIDTFTPVGPLCFFISLFLYCLRQSASAEVQREHWDIHTQSFPAPKGNVIMKMLDKWYWRKIEKTQKKHMEKTNVLCKEIVNIKEKAADYLYENKEQIMALIQNNVPNIESKYFTAYAKEVENIQIGYEQNNIQTILTALKNIFTVKEEKSALSFKNYI